MMMLYLFDGDRYVCAGFSFSGRCEAQLRQFYELLPDGVELEWADAHHTEARFFVEDGHAAYVYGLESLHHVPEQVSPDEFIQLVCSQLGM